MFPQLVTKQTRNSLVKFLFSCHNVNKKFSLPISTSTVGNQGCNSTNFSPPPPKKSNKATKQVSKSRKISEDITAKRETKEKKIRVVETPRLASEASFKFDDKKRFKNELKLKRFEYEWYIKIRQERKAKLDKINETIKILSLSSNPKEFCSVKYSEMKRENALENYRKRELGKCRERRINLLNLYYNSSDFVTLNNLDTKIADMYDEVRQPFTTTLEDMQIDYLEGGGIVDDLELKRRLDRIKDILSDTSQGGNQKLGLNKIEELHKRKESETKSLHSNIELEPKLAQSLDS
ncbi:6103_t:CDS:2 [Rhizophagus irregularis]|nr:6103_t:CDS:2 [Rhizophagus irregularis]